MTTLRFSTIWDIPSSSRRDEREASADKAPHSERFLTIWDNPRSSHDKNTAAKRTPRKLTRFYI